MCIRDSIIVPSQDVVLGLYYMTREKVKDKGEGGIFANIDEVERAFHNRFLGLHAKIKLKITTQNEEKPTEIVETTCGRALFSKIVPDEIPFSVTNKTMDSKEISRLINRCYREVGPTTITDLPE